MGSQTRSNCPKDDPQAGKLAALLDGYQDTALLYVAARLGLADLLADGPKVPLVLARSLGVHAPSLLRILRGLVVLGVCSDEGGESFGLTSLGSLLQSGVDGSLRNLAIVSGEQYMRAWGGLLHSVTTGQTAFEHVFGMSPWEYRRRNSHLGDRFISDLNEETSRAAGAILDAYDFSRFGVICDVGGGHGALVAAVLKACPSATGILFEQPHVAAGAHSYLKSQGVASRCRVAEGDFFEAIPVEADVYIFKSVIHDWADEQAVAILANCRKALSERGRAILIERLMPARATDAPDTIRVDIQMLAVTGGLERGQARYRTLLAAAGFTLTKIIATSSPFSVIEAMSQG